VNCWAGGHGVEDYDQDNDPESFKTLGVTIFSQDYAQDKVKPWLLQDIVFEDEFFASLPDMDNNGLSDAGGDTCSGDSGSGLVCRRGNQLVVYGVNSWGSDCGKAGQPGVWANVYAAMDWIQETTGIQVRVIYTALAHNFVLQIR